MPDAPAESKDVRATGEPSQPGLIRALGLGMAMAVVVGNVIGSGIYVKPGGIARQAGDFRTIIVAWVVGGLICLMGALCMAELGTMLPKAGGLYVYLREAYGRPVAFLFGWTDFLFSHPASIGALAVIFVGTVLQVSGYALGVWGQFAIQVAVIALMAWINILGVIWGGRMQGATTLAKACLLGGVAALPWIMGATGSASLTPANLATSVIPERATLSGQFAAALLGVLWAYNGWEALGSVAEEIRSPQRNIPRALFGGISILIVLYVSAVVAYHLVLPMPEMVAAGDHAAEVMVAKLVGPRGHWLMSISVMLSAFGGINSNMLLGPRVSFAMGRDGLFFHRLGTVHARYHTPALAIVVQAVMSIALIAVSSALVQFSTVFQRRSVFDLLTDYVVFASSIFYLLTVLGVLRLRRTRPDLPRPYRTFGYPWVPILYGLFYVWFLTEVYRGDPGEANIGVGLILLGLPVYAISRRTHRKSDHRA